MEELDPKARELIDAYTQAKTAPGGAQDRVWNRVEQSTATGSSLGGNTAKIGVALALLAGLALWRWPTNEVEVRDTYASGVVPVQASAGDPDAVPEVPAPAAPTPPVVQPTPVPPPMAAVPEEATEEEAEPPAPARTKEKKTAPAPTELELIARAKKALAAGHAKAALSATREHTKLYPKGMLLEERSLLEIEARCALGQVDRVERLRESFLKAHAGSPLADRVRHSCQE
jgi:hypothetical protein